MTARFTFRFLALFVVVLLLSIFVVGQRTEGSIAGVVTDPKGAVITGAKVTISNQDTGASSELRTNEQGYYRAPFLRPGLYEVRVEAPGFAPFTLKDLEVRVSVVSRADAHMQLGGVEAAVEVHGGAPLVETEEARLATTISTREVSELPLAGRDIYQLSLLQPGVTATNAPVISNTSFNTFDSAFISNGASVRGNNFVLDGTTNNNEWLGGTPAITPSLEAVQEFQIQTLNFSAEYGRNNGSVMNIITKSGTNNLHGSVYWYHRNEKFNARNYFDKEELPLRQHQFGFSVGGPIRKDKTFFFGNFEGSRFRRGYTQVSFVETPEFRDLVQTQRPGSLAAMFYRDFPAPGCLLGDPDYDDPFDAGGLQPVDNPGGAFGGPSAAPDGVNDYCYSRFTDSPSADSNQYAIRFDHLFSSNDRFSARWLHDLREADVSREQGIPALRGFRGDLTGRFGDLNASYAKTFSPTLINDFRFAFNRSDFGIAGKMPQGETASILEAAGTPDFFGTLFFDEGVSPVGRFLFIPRDFVFNVFTFSDVVTSVQGNHTLKFGGELRYIQENSRYDFETRPFFEFNTIFDFANDSPYWHDALVNRLPGDPNFGQYTSTPRNFRWNQWGLFLQDDWKVRSNLTLNLGLRYEVFGTPSEKQDRMSNIVLGSGSDIFERMGNARFDRVGKLFDTDYNNFAPRIGIAWDPWGTGKTSIRSGFGLAYLEPYSNMWSNSTRFTPPDATWIGVAPLLGLGTDVHYTFPFEPSPDMAVPPSPTNSVPGTQIASNAVNPELTTAYSMQWFLGVQHEIFKDYGLSINYVGTRGVGLYLWEDYNRFAGDICGADSCDFVENRQQPEWGTIWLVDNAADSIYHGMNVQLRKAATRGLQFSANYTFGKLIDAPSSDAGLGDFGNVSAGAGTYLGAQDIHNRSADRGPGEFDVRHRFAFSGIWDLPKLTNAPGFIRHAFGGWQFNGIVSLQTGRPFTVSCLQAYWAGCDFNMDGDELDRPNDPGVPYTGYEREDFVSGIFSLEDFCPGGLVPFYEGTPCLEPGTNGNLGRNTYRGPGYASVDTGLFKNIVLKEPYTFQFRWEVFNVFNRANLWNPSSSLSSPLFGQSTRAFPGREMQFALKFLF